MPQDPSTGDPRGFINIFSRRATGFYTKQNFLNGTKTYSLDGEIRWANSSSQLVNLPLIITVLIVWFGYVYRNKC